MERAMTEIGVILDKPAGRPAESGAQRHPAWQRLVAAVEEIRPLQVKDGSIDAATHDLADARAAVGALLEALDALAPLFPHGAEDHAALRAGFARWVDRESARFRVVTKAAAETVRLELPAEAAELVGSQDKAQDAFVLWDMIHDRTHSHGDLPFDPFMIKQRMPYWLYSLEELRCDLTTFREAVRLAAEGLTQGRAMQYAILFDRLF